MQMIIHAESLVGIGHQQNLAPRPAAGQYKYIYIYICIYMYEAYVYHGFGIGHPQLLHVDSIRCASCIYIYT